MGGVIWYRFVRYSGTDWSATLVPIRPLLWYRLERCAGTDSSATVVPIRRYYHYKKQTDQGRFSSTERFPSASHSSPNMSLMKPL